MTADSSPESRLGRASPSAIWKTTCSHFSASNLLLRFMATVDEWTPCGLVWSYFVFSVSLYCFCPPPIIAMFWYIYLITNFYIAGATVLEAFLSLQPTRDARRAWKRFEARRWRFPTPDRDLLILDLLIVAYLPNEAEIIMDRLHYALDEVVYPQGKIRINLVYNTPKPIEPLETKLLELASRKPHLRIHKVPNSTSKADNLNYFFSLPNDGDVITIFDADHYTHPYGPRWAVERFMQDKEIDIIQGRCIIFNADESWLAGIVAVEFDKIYAVSHPGRANQWGFALFAGSNGYWRAPLLKAAKMDGNVLTEDIDSALRAVRGGAKIVHDLNVQSYELAPTTMAALWKQRLRWTQGWSQVSLRHLPMTVKSTETVKLNLAMRFGLLSLLLIRESSYYLVTQYTCLVFSIVVTQWPHSGSSWAKLIFFPFPVARWFFIIAIVCLFVTLWITNRARSEFATRRMMFLFAILYMPYIIIMATMGLWGHARQITRYSKWNATKRS